VGFRCATKRIYTLQIPKSLNAQSSGAEQKRESRQSQRASNQSLAGILNSFTREGGFCNGRISLWGESPLLRLQWRTHHLVLPASGPRLMLCSERTSPTRYLSSFSEFWSSSKNLERNEKWMTILGGDSMLVSLFC
jgi:hypothetical protein